MPLYRIQTFKRIGVGKEWSNTYWVRAVDLDEASGFGSIAINAEGSVHRANVNFVRYRISTAQENDGVYTTVVVNFAGGLAVASSQLPLWNVCRVDFTVFGGRPSYKFLRLPIEELDVQNGIFTSFFQNQIQTFYADVIGASGGTLPATSGFVDESNNDFQSVTVHPNMVMRQTYRKKRRSGGGGLSGS